MDTETKCQGIDVQDICWRVNCAGCRFQGAFRSDSLEAPPYERLGGPIFTPRQSNTVPSEGS